MPDASLPCLAIAGVGKSCLLLRFADDSFTSSFITTIGYAWARQEALRHSATACLQRLQHTDGPVQRLRTLASTGRNPPAHGVGLAANFCHQPLPRRCLSSHYHRPLIAPLPAELTSRYGRCRLPTRSSRCRYGTQRGKNASERLPAVRRPNAAPSAGLVCVVQTQPTPTPQRSSATHPCAVLSGGKRNSTAAARRPLLLLSRSPSGLACPWGGAVVAALVPDLHALPSLPRQMLLSLLLSQRTTAMRWASCSCTMSLTRAHSTTSKGGWAPSNNTRQTM